jgi:DNA-binding GntR family transcriptional regulator
MDAFDIDQIFEIRDLLESCLVAHAAVARTEQELLDGATLSARMPRLAAAGDIRGFADVDVEFHRLLWEMAKRPRVTEALLPVADQSRRYLSLSSRSLKSESSETLAASCKEHAEILAAIGEKDVVGAVAAIRKHMSSSRKRILLSMTPEKEGDPGRKHSQSQSLAYAITWTEGEL